MRAAGWTHGGLIATEVPAGKTHVERIACICVERMPCCPHRVDMGVSWNRMWPNLQTTCGGKAAMHCSSCNSIQECIAKVRVMQHPLSAS